MLHLIPRSVPSFRELSADCGNPSAPDLARALGVTERTVYRWQAGEAPQAARLALFWVTPWGWSAHQAEARRVLADWRMLAEARQRELDALRAEVDHLVSLGDFGSANAPRWSAAGR